MLYQTSQFGGEAPTEGQRRFTLATDDFLALVEKLLHRHRRDRQVRVGIAPHSLRAVPPEPLRAAIDALGTLDADAPIHIHAAEQTKEVQDCLAWSGKRPVEWLLANAGVDRRWCLVHCTHMTPEETRGLAASGAVVGLCPTTEGNLGDGVFPLPAFLEAGGRFGIGTDSNVATSPVEELRWLEYVQRLVARARNLTEKTVGAATGAKLYRRGAGRRCSGARPADRRVGAGPARRHRGAGPRPSRPARPRRRHAARFLDLLGNANPVRDVMVGGHWVVRDGVHPHEEQALADYRRAVARLGA